MARTLQGDHSRYTYSYTILILMYIAYVYTSMITHHVIVLYSVIAVGLQALTVVHSSIHTQAREQRVLQATANG
jgi:hypothetical protein